MRERYQALRASVATSFLLGMIAAILSCITGFMLSQEGDYQGTTINFHQWIGIATAVVSIVLYFVSKRHDATKAVNWLSFLLVAMIIITGHLGATLTHGENFLLEGLGTELPEKLPRKAIPDAQAAQAYTDVIKPIFDEKCVSCHGAGKQKGKFRLDLPDLMMKGGKVGNDIIPGKPEESELIKRILLDRGNDDHMPPRDKPQLSPDEIALLHWWVENGAPLNKQVRELDQPEKIKPALLALEKESVPENSRLPELPLVPAAPADAGAIAKMKERGITVIPVSQNSNYLSVSFVAVDSFQTKDLELLSPIKKQLLWLRLSDQPLHDTALKLLVQFTQLSRLLIDRTKITDSGIVLLKGLPQLKYLNLVGTSVTAPGLEVLKDNKQLRSLYLYQTNISESDRAGLQKMFPGVTLDFGGYKVPTLESDTITVTEKNRYKRDD